MSEIRIKDLTTASSLTGEEFLALDTTDGTNKISVENFSSEILSDTKEQIDELNNKRPLFIQGFRVKFPKIPANGTAATTVNIYATGYTPLGCVRWANDGSSAFYVYQNTIDSNELTVCVKNILDTDITGASILIYILYQRN